METNIFIGGKEISSFVRLEIAQAFNEHHRFELIIRQDILIRQEHTIQSTREFIGKFVSIGFGSDGNEDNFFKGLISEVVFSQDKGAWGNLILKGYGPTYLLEGGNHYASFSERSLYYIAQELCANIASNDIQLNFAPKYTAEIPYCCQYNESNFAFLKRLAAEYGEWLYSDGKTLYFGKPEAKDPIKLNYGEDVENIRFSLKLSPHKHTLYSYHSAEDEILSVEQGSTNGNAFQQKAIKETDELYRKGVINIIPQAVISQDHLNTISKNKQGQKIAETLILQADGDNTKVQIGSRVQLNINQEDLEGNKTAETSSFLVTSITHVLTGNGTYSNSFEGIQAEAGHVPTEVPRVIAENQVAIVKDNNDPLGFGRVKVQMPWQKGEWTDWIRVLSPDAGSSGTVSKNRGFVFVPEVSDQVIVGFEHNHPDRPFVLGSVFHGKNGSGGGKDNNVRTIITRSGHTLQFDDTSGSESITITDKKKNVITLDTASGSITISASENISITAKNIDLNAKENISFTAGSDISTSAKENITQSAGENLNVNAGKEATLAAKNITSQATEKASFNAKELEHTAKEVKINSTSKDMLLASGKKVNLQSGEKIKLF